MNHGAEIPCARGLWVSFAVTKKEGRRRLSPTPLAVACHLDVVLPCVWPGAYSDDKVAGARSFWLPHHFHASLPRHLITLAVIAAVARAGRIGPCILTPARTRQDVVNGQVRFGERLTARNIAGTYTAINARIIIPRQHALTTPVCLSARHV